MSTVTTLFVTPTAARKLAEELADMDERVVSVMIQQSPTPPHNMLVTLDAGWGKKSFWVDQDGTVVPGGGLATPSVTDRDHHTIRMADGGDAIFGRTDDDYEDPRDFA